MGCAKKFAKGMEPIILEMNPRATALHVLRLADPDEKAFEARRLFADTQAGRVGASALNVDTVFDEPPGLPGRPPLPQLVPPKDVPTRSPFTLEGRAALLHAITHIEFNAINLALDAVWRFAGMPPQYYLDWLRVASEEALHFGLMRTHLQNLGFDYGQFDSHDGLWLMVQRTSHDVLARMALVPRTLEARGLDASPPRPSCARPATCGRWRSWT
jgi:uncharacterized ferritin-like protein (DUF455 family)